MRHALGSIDAGDSVTMVVKRDGETKSFDCELVRELPVYRSPFLGILPDPLYEGPGVKIRAVLAESPAAKASIEKDQVIRKLGDVEIDSIESLERSLAFVDYREPAEFGVTKISNLYLAFVKGSLNSRNP